jgi:hypothetical protein
MRCRTGRSVFRRAFAATTRSWRTGRSWKGTLRSQPTNQHWVSRLVEMLRAGDELMRRGGVEVAALKGVPPLLRRRTAFPYVDGLAFVADLYRTGGVSLIDRAFGKPPVSTEQVLHPEKYLAGEAPVKVPPPAPPDGWKRRGGGTMGELTISVMLGQCDEHADGPRDARGWGGDSYALVSDASGRLATLWSTVWDDEASAARFEGAVGRRAGCLHDVKLGPDLGTDILAVREGRRVAVVQGLGEGARAQASILLATPIEEPSPEPPFGPRVIPPLVIPEQAFLHKGRFEHGVWISPPLGIRMRVPTGFEPAKKGWDAEAAMSADYASAGFDLLMVPPGKETHVQYMRQMLKAQRELPWMKDQSLDYQDAGGLEVAGVQAPAYTWRRSSGNMLRLVFIPACGGKATVAAQLYWSGQEGHMLIADWLSELRLPAPDSEACVTLGRMFDQ